MPDNNPAGREQSGSSGAQSDFRDDGARRGFATMARQRQREIAAAGGRASHASGTAHRFTSAEARAAGQKGGAAGHEMGTAHEFTPEEARQAGRRGQASRRSRTGGQQLGP